MAMTADGVWGSRADERDCGSGSETRVSTPVGQRTKMEHLSAKEAVRGSTGEYLCQDQGRATNGGQKGVPAGNCRGRAGRVAVAGAAFSASSGPPASRSIRQSVEDSPGPRVQPIYRHSRVHHCMAQNLGEGNSDGTADGDSATKENRLRST